MCAQNDVAQTSTELNHYTPCSNFTTSTEKSLNQSRTFTSPAYSTDSQTELESVSDDFEEDSSDEEDMMDDTCSALKVLESRLLSVLCHDLGLAARLIPQIHHLVQLGHDLEASSGSTEVPADGSDGASESTTAQGGLNTPLSTPATIEGTTRRRKRGQESDQDEDQDDGSPKRQRSKPPHDLVRQSDFACHFHKMNPRKYNPLTNRKYLHCICPSPSELRRTK